MKEIKQATVFKFKKKNKVLIHSTSNVQMGAGIATEPYVWLDASSPELAEKVLYALEGSRTGLPTPDNWSLFQKAFLEAIGLKKHKDLYDDTVCVWVTKKEGKLIFSPSINQGKDGFVNSSHSSLELLEGSSHDEINRLLHEALDKSE